MLQPVMRAYLHPLLFKLQVTAREKGYLTYSKGVYIMKHAYVC